MVKCIVCGKDCLYNAVEELYFCGGELENPVPGKDPIHFLTPVTSKGNDSHIFLSNGIEMSLYDNCDMVYIYAGNQFDKWYSSNFPPPKLKYPKDKLKWGNEQDLIDQLNKLFILI